MFCENIVEETQSADLSISGNKSFHRNHPISLDGWCYMNDPLLTVDYAWKPKFDFLTSCHAELLKRENQCILHALDFDM
jgi:hypothetical protein